MSCGKSAAVVTAHTLLYVRCYIVIQSDVKALERLLQIFSLSPQRFLICVRSEHRYLLSLSLPPPSHALFDVHCGRGRMALSPCRECGHCHSNVTCHNTAKLCSSLTFSVLETLTYSRLLPCCL